MLSPDPCPLCDQVSLSLLPAVRSGRYRHCANCDLIAQVPDELPDSLRELALYYTHQNAADNLGYQRFLAQLTEPLCARLPVGAQGLDYGSGPEPVLAGLLTGRGFVTVAYDPFFAPRTDLLESTYDFVVCTEAAEHFHRPGREFSRLVEQLVPGGWLGLMTELHDGPAGFGDWWYHKDPTHVSFYSACTIDWIARHFGFRVDVCGPRVVLLQKQRTDLGTSRALPGSC